MKEQSPYCDSHQESYKDLYVNVLKNDQQPNVLTQRAMLQKSALPRSHSLKLLGNGGVTTLSLWHGVHRTKDIRPVTGSHDHEQRIRTKEGTPWVPGGLMPVMKTSARDPFVQKYRFVLN